MSRLRVKVYAPHVPASPASRFAVTTACRLGDFCDATPGLEVSITAAVFDAAGAQLGWPVARFTPVTADELKADPYGLATYARLTADETRAFDVLFLPHPWKFYPAGRLTPTAAPIVAYVPDLGFDDADLGSVTDASRAVMASIARDCAAVVFPSAAIRDRAVHRYGIAPGRAAVVAPCRTLDAAPADAARIAAELGLPPDFVLLLDAGRPDTAAGLRAALRRAGVEWPVVALESQASENRGGVDENADGEPSIRLGRLSDEAYAAVLALAKAVVADAISPTPHLDVAHLDALTLRKPLLCRTASDAGPWSGDAVAAGYPFHDDDEAAAQLARLRDQPGAFDDRLDRGERLARSRTGAKHARELFDVFRTVHEAPPAARVRFRAEPMACREKRILWLINHGAVHACEVALLRSLGYEIYSPKQMPKTDYRSLSIVHADDDRSTLPRWVLERLNRHNFYEDPLPEDLVELLNGYFGTAIISVWGTMFVEAAYKFRGRILARAFGREHPVTYFQYWDHFGGGSLWERIRSIRHRFWLTAPYDSVGDWEPEPLKGCSLTLPLGIADRVWRNEGKWTGERPELFFICPSINLTPQYYGKVYRDFKYHFGDLPHRISGNQETPVPDEAVTGKVPEAAFRRMMNELRVMYYHSREPRHLHYHPLEAIVHGMPVVYLTGGLMDEFGGPGQPGACETEADARRKIRRILDGDRALIDEIRAKQGKILETFTDASVRREWIEKFIGRVMAAPLTPDAIPPSHWPASIPGPVSTSVPAVADTRPFPRMGVYLGSAPNPEAVRYGAVLGGLAAAEAVADKVEILGGRRAVEGRLSALGRHPRLRIRTLREHEYLPRTSVPRSQPTLVAAPDASGSAVSPWFGGGRLKRTVRSVEERLQETRASHRSRIAQSASTVSLSALYYARAVYKQRTLRTRGSTAIVVLKETFKTTRRIGPAPLTFEQVRRITGRNEVTVFVQPTDLLAADIPLAAVSELPAVVVIHDLAHEYSAVGRDRSLARHRETLLWCKAARMVVFGSEHVRREAIRRYGIPAAKTAVVTLPPAFERRDPPTPEQAEAARDRLGLPKRFVLTAGDGDPNTNALALLEAAAVLKWRRGSAPAVVFAGRGANRFIREGGDAYSVKVREVIREGRLDEGRDFHVLDRVAPEDLAGLYAAATAYVTVPRFEAQVHGTVLQAMLAKRPVICGDVPANVEQLGTSEEYALLVPPDDAGALAEAIARVLDDPEDARLRADRAFAWAKQFDGVAALDDFRRILAVAAGRTTAGPAPVVRPEPRAAAA